MSTWGHLGLQDSNTPLMEQLLFFHDHSLIILVMTTTLVGYLMIMLVTNKFMNRYLLEGQEVEIVWTVVPAITLVFIAMPSLRLLYLLDEVDMPNLTLKAIGHQWYWSYEYSDFPGLEFDSYMIPTSELAQDGFRLLDVDNRVILPYLTQIRLLISAADVLHCWTVPVLGVKLDGVPGRINQIGFFMNRPGLYYGQCSEICGSNHSFMPIVIESVSLKSFISWLNNTNL